MFLKSSWLPGAASALRRRLKATAQSGGSAAPIGGLIGQKEGPASVLILHDLRPRPPAQHRLAAQGAATAGSPWWRKAGRNVFPAARMMSSPSDQGDEADKQEGGRQASRPLVESANAQGEVAADCQKPTKRFRCIVEYDGTDFSGFQSQGFKVVFLAPLLPLENFSTLVCLSDPPPAVNSSQIPCINDCTKAATLVCTPSVDQSKSSSRFSKTGFSKASKQN